MDISFDLYKIFYLTARYLSFSEAAEKLFISQSAVSQSVKNLENQLGVQLFTRKTRQIKLTPEGELLLKHVEQAYNFIKSGESKLSEIQNMSQGEIRIGVGDTVCRYFMVSYLQKYNNMLPNIKIHVVNRTSSQITDMLKNGHVDIGIVTLPVSDRSLLIREFLEVEDIFVASYKFDNISKQSLTLEELSKYPLLMLHKNTSTRRNFEKFLNQRHASIKPEIELESMELLVEFARIGLGIAYVIKESAMQAIEKGDLFKLSLSEEIPLRKIGIATVKDVPLSRASVEFIKLLTENGYASS